MGFKNLIWWLECRRYFTKAAYDRACGYFDDMDMDPLEHTLAQHTVLVMGIQEDILLAASIELAKRGCNRFFLLSTDKHDTGTAAITKIQSHFQDKGMIKLYSYDISDIHNVKSFVKELERDLKSTSSQISMLLFQHESMQEKWLESSTSAELMQPDFCGHVLAPYCIISQLINHHLLSLSRKNDNFYPRVILVGNPAFLRRPLLHANLEGSNWRHSYKPGRAYANFKREQYEMLAALSSRYPECDFYYINPGLVDNLPLKHLSNTTYKSTKKKCRTTGQAADGVVWACVSPSLHSKIPSGSVIVDRMKGSAYLPCCFTRPSSSAREKFMARLDEYKRRYYDEVRERPSVGTVVDKSSQLVNANSDDIYNNPELPTYSDEN